MRLVGERVWSIGRQSRRPASTQANTRELRIDKDAVGDEPVRRAALASVEVFVNDAEVVLGYMREVWAAGAFSHCPNVRRGRFQAIVHPDVSLARDLDSRLIESDAACVGRSSERHQNIGSVDRFLAGFGLDPESDVPAGTSVDTQHVCA